MRRSAAAVSLAVALLLMPLGVAASTLVGWNNLGMHCIDADYAVFSLLPPYNTIHAQLVDAQGHLLRDPGNITVTYEAVADPDGSINRSSLGKTNFWSHVEALFGVSLSEDVGLTQLSMPGAANQPQPMSFDSVAGWFIAEGIPITPYDDNGHKNPYPLMHLVARDGNGTLLASTDIVLPVSDEMDCSSCHASGSSPAAQPLSGWVRDPDAQRDMRLNILRLHDDRESFRPAYQAALQTAGYDAAGLFATASGGKAILCARCHLSEALPGSGIEGIAPLTQAVHSRMAFVLDPLTNLPLASTDNRSACYRCHPGAVTRCLRGAMGNAVAADGTRAIQCQSCHGGMLDVASPERTGWLNEPVCQSCHTGTAIKNSGAIRYTSAFDDAGAVRQPADQTYATNADTPAPGLSLYRFSKGHGGLACEACHGSTHAEFPSSQRNDNLQSEQRQGHAGTLSECSACHAIVPETADGGPHGLHPIGQEWVQRHPDIAEQSGATACRTCHGNDYRGTALSRVQADRVLDTAFGRKVFWRGFQVGCYTCHNGPSSEHANPNRAPLVADASLATSRDVAATIALTATDADGNALTLRVVSQPEHGTVALADAAARYFPEVGYSGADAFTFAASDGSTDSNLGTVRVSVSGVACAGDCDGSAEVTVDELVHMVNVALGVLPMGGCSAGDLNGDGEISIDEIVAAVNVALTGC
jgi:hypothetical protein